MAEIDLSLAVFFTTGSGSGGTPYGKYEDGAIVTNIGWPDFYFPGMLLDPDTEYEVTVTYDPGHPLDLGGRTFFAGPTHTDQTDQDALYSGWDYNAWIGGGPETDTFSFTIPSGQDPDFLTPVFESDLNGALVSLDIDPPPGTGGGGSESAWSTEIRLTTDADPFDAGSDEGSLATGDLCYLPNSDLVIVMSFSHYSYAIRLWAIDVSGTEPDVGPLKVVNGTDADFSWMTNPHPGDERGAAMLPGTFVIPLTQLSFALVGPGNETYNEDGELDGAGEYVHAASFFSVNPTTKVITQSSFVVVDSNALGPPPFGGWVDDLTAAPWGDHGVVIMDNNENHIMTVMDYGFVTVFLDIEGLDNPNHNSPVVFGDQVVWLVYDSLTSTDDQVIYSMDLNTGAVTVGDLLVGSGDWITDQFSCATTVGEAAFITSTNQSGNSSDIMLSLIDPATLAADTPTNVATSVWTYGWTADFGGNVKSISPMSGGRMLVSYVDFFSRTMYCVIVGATKAPGTPVLIPLENPNEFFVQMARSVSCGGEKVAAMMVRQTNTGYEGGEHIFGVYFTLGDLTPVVASPDALPERIRSRFWGQRW